MARITGTKNRYTYIWLIKKLDANDKLIFEKKYCSLEHINQDEELLGVKMSYYKLKHILLQSRPILNLKDGSMLLLYKIKEICFNEDNLGKTDITEN